MTQTELIGRVFCAGRDTWGVRVDSGELTARISGALRYKAATPADLPAVGDFVAVEGGSQQIHNGQLTCQPFPQSFIYE